MLDENELDAAWAKYLETREVEDMDPLVRQYARLAGFLARRALAKAPAHQDAEDIHSYAQHGLLNAIQRFDPAQGVKFETYATRRITGSIIDGQRLQDPLARATRKKVKLVEAAIAALWERLDRDPTLQEIAEQSGESIESVRATLLAQKSLTGSLDVDNSVSETRGIDSEAETLAQMGELRSQIADRLARLPARCRAFVLAYYCDGQNLKQASESLGISGDWSRQTRNQILEALKPNA